DTHDLGRLSDRLGRLDGAAGPGGACLDIRARRVGATSVGHDDDVRWTVRSVRSHGSILTPDQARRASSGTNISADVNEPCLLTRLTSPVSAGSRNATGACATRATSPRRSSTSGTGIPPSHPSASTCRLVRTQAT